ncbi:MAG: Abi family protein [Planctomycetota bacterium]|jgi:abortive infection bacteriophage resistance protein
MKYTKPALTYEQQADLLMSRGLIADKTELVEKLRAVNYYRLSGYWYPFRIPDDPNEAFQPGITLRQVWQRYTFDRQLRLLVLDAIERIEVSVRTQVVYQLSHRYGPFGYVSASTLPKLSTIEFCRLIRSIKREWLRSSEEFIQHFRSKYEGNRLPLWMASEIMTFGTLLTMFKGLEQNLKQTIAADYGIADSILQSWLVALNGIRNICAHHGRLWNRLSGYKPLIPKQRKHPQWHDPIEITNDRMFGMLTILKYKMNIIAPQSSWADRFKALLTKYPDIPIVQMGFPENWTDCPIWK